MYPLVENLYIFKVQWFRVFLLSEQIKLIALLVRIKNKNN